MAFSSAVVTKTVFGNKKVHSGTFTNAGGSTGGDIDTGLAYCEHLFLQHVDSAVTTGVPVVNETLPVAGAAVTIVTDADKSGNWVAVGR